MQAQADSGPAVRHKGPKAVIRQHQGVPALFINGEPHAALAYMTFDMQERFIREFGEAGMDLFTFSTNCDYDYYRLSADVRVAPDEYDYRQFDERMDMILRAAPNAKIFPRVYICSPPWWDKEHPEELLTGEAGVYSPQPDFGWLTASVLERNLHPRKMTVPSFSSQLWLKDSGDALRRLIEHSEEKYGYATIGYHLITGGSQEWYYWGAFEDLFADVSVPQQKAFRDWLAEHGQKGADRARVPAAEDRRASEYGIFRDPKDPAGRMAVLYWQFHAEALVRAMRHFAATARQAMGPEKLVGVFYGYIVDLCRHPTCWHNSGHLALQAMLEDPNINFVSSPTAYKDRRAGAGFSIFNSVTESVMHHGKIWWNENDILTYKSRKLKDPLFLHPKTPVETQHIQRREFGNVLCHGTGTWWFDMWGGYYDDKPLMDDIRKMIVISRKAMHVDRSAAAEVAVVFDDASILHTECSNKLTVPLVPEQLIELGHIGAPFSLIHVDDLPQIRRHRFYIFLDLFYASEERVKMATDFLRAPGTTALFVYAPGLVGDSIDAGRMQRLTGIRLGVDTRPGKLMVKTSSGEYGLEKEVAPVTYACDSEAEVLGTVSGTSRAGLVRKNVGGATTIFSTAPKIPASIMRMLAKAAGVHLYAENGEVIYASKSFISVNAVPGAGVRLNVPGEKQLYDLFRECEIRVAHGVAELERSEDGTWLLFRGGKRDWERAGQ